jgi:hypothetical protein
VLAMRLPRKIVILIHERDVKASRRPYVIWGVKEIWERQGIEVEVVRGVDRRVDADLAISHVALTIVPEEYRAYLARYPVVLNRGAWDMSKRRISANLVRPGEGYEGPVIVKTDRNYGGRREEEFFANVSWDVGRRFASLWRRLAWGRTRREAQAWRTVGFLDPDTYPIYDSPREVPPAVFENPALVVERFLPEREGDLYALRACAFLGDRHVSLRLLSPHPVVKASSKARTEVPPHPGVFAVRERLGLDFGKIDYVVRDGEMVLFDANRNPGFGKGGAGDFRQHVAEHLAGGLAALLPRE